MAYVNTYCAYMWYNDVMAYTKCKIKGCTRLGSLKPDGTRYFPKGLCRHHYRNLKEYGSPLAQKGACKDRRSKSSAYKTWQKMKDRCYNRNNPRYKNYGGRGIKVCHRWLEPNGKGFENFLADMGEVPDGCSLDRIDVNSGYSPDNCRWADKWVQAWNKTVSSNTGVVGVHYDERKEHFVAHIVRNKKQRSRCFHTLHEAIEQRRKWENEL